MIDRRPKQTYHPFVLVAFFLDILPAEVIAVIPRSTLYDWKHKQVNELVGYGWYCEQQPLFTTLQAVATNRQLLRINRALLSLIALQRFMKKYQSSLAAGLLGTVDVAVRGIQKMRIVFGMAFTLKALGLSHTHYWRLRQKTRCALSVLHQCRIKHPAQLLSKEVKAIQQYGTDIRFLHWPLSSVYYQMIRDKAATFQLSTFYKYIRLLKLERKAPVHRRKNHQSGIRAEKPLTLLHADVTVFKPMDQRKAYIYLVQDNFSRALLGWSLSTECKAATMKELLQRVHTDHLRPQAVQTCRVLTDDGSENQGAAHKFMEQTSTPSIQHLIAQKDIQFSNSMIEAANKNLKYRFLYHQQIPDIEALRKYLALAVEDYNNRPHAVLRGLTPLEVLHGKNDALLPPAAITAGRLTRITANKQQSCCGYSF